VFSEFSTCIMPCMQLLFVGVDSRIALLRATLRIFRGPRTGRDNPPKLARLAMGVLAKLCQRRDWRALALH
jgi:hypothetical protein